MSRYNMFFTKDDAAKQEAEIKRLSDTYNLDIDMKKVKRQSGDGVFTIMRILQQQYEGV